MKITYKYALPLSIAINCITLACIVFLLNKEPETIVEVRQIRVEVPTLVETKLNMDDIEKLFKSFRQDPVQIFIQKDSEGGSESPKAKPEEEAPKPKKEGLRRKVDYHKGFVAGVKHWEGYRSKRYVCSGGAVTIGYGFTGKEIKNRNYITKSVADYELEHEVLPKYGKIVDKNVKVKLTEYQRLALIDFTYNLGEGNLRRLVNGKGRLNSGNYDSVLKLMPQYRKSGGKVRTGLVKRRAWGCRLWKGQMCSNYGN